MYEGKGKSILKSGENLQHKQSLLMSTARFIACELQIRICTKSRALLEKIRRLTLRLLISYIYMELLVKPEMLTSFIYGPTFGNAETVSFYLLHNVSTLNQCREVSCVTFVCKHFASFFVAPCLERT